MAELTQQRITIGQELPDGEYVAVTQEVARAIQEYLFGQAYKDVAPLLQALGASYVFKPVKKEEESEAPALKSM